MVNQIAWGIKDDTVICRRFSNERIDGSGFEQETTDVENLPTPIMKVIHKGFDFEHYEIENEYNEYIQNVVNLHSVIMEETNENPLEISVDLTVPFEYLLDNFHLTYNCVSLECVWQSSKKFEYGGPYKELLGVNPFSARLDVRLEKSGKLVAYCLDDEEWPARFKTVFYDYLCVQSILQTFGKDLDLSDYEWFTDVNFLPRVQISSRAKQVAIYKLIQKKNMWDCLDSKKKWIDFYSNHVTKNSSKTTLTSLKAF